MTTTLRDRIAELLEGEYDGCQVRAERAAAAILALVSTGVCWHCKVQLEPTRPRCERCPEECDYDDCPEEGCATAPAAET